MPLHPDGWKIPTEVSDIHGITHEHAAAVGVNESLALNLFFQLWGRYPRVAHNRTFDQRIIRIAAKRYMSEGDADAWADKEEFADTMLLAKPIMQMLPKGRYGYKSPKLSEAYEFFTGKQLENAHSAMADTRACMEVYWHLLDHEAKAA